MLAAAVVVAAAAFTVAVWTPTDHRQPAGSGAVGSAVPSGAAPPAGPLVYYEVLDATSAKLIERRLDGRSLPRLVAERTDADAGRIWVVDPTGTTAIATIDGGTGTQSLTAVSVATGDTLWTATSAVVGLSGGVWAADGSRLAALCDGCRPGGQAVVVVDVRTGGVRQVPVPDDVVLQGVARDGAVILRQRAVSATGVVGRWQFLRIDPAVSAVAPAADVSTIGPASARTDDVDPAGGIEIDAVSGPNDTTDVRLQALAGGPARILANVPSVDTLTIDPLGRGVAIWSGDTIRFVTIDGQASQVFQASDRIDDVSWSPGGAYLGVTTEGDGAAITVLERATGRAVGLPRGLAGAAAEIQLARIVGEMALPADPLPAAEPTPTPTPGPSGADAAGTAGILSAWVDRSGPTQIGHVERLVPTEGGGMRIAAAMPTLDLGPRAVPDDGGPAITVLPRPGSGDVLVWVASGGRSTGWLWDGADSRIPLPVPRDWPTGAFGPTWRPDGRAIAAAAGRVTPMGFEDVFVVAELGGEHTRIVPIVGAYDVLVGWWSPSELHVAVGSCPVGCDGPIPRGARLRVADGHLTPLVAGDRGHAPIDQISTDGSALVLSISDNDRSADVTIDWPASLGPIDAVQPIGFGGDRRSILVAVQTADGTDVDRIADPIGRAVDGRLADPRPERLGHVAGRGLQIDVSPDGAWAIVRDRVGNRHLVRFGDGRTWPLDRDPEDTWPGGAQP